MSSASQTPDSSRARRTRGSSQRAAARGERSRGSSRASLLGRVLIALILLAAGGGIAWWALHPAEPNATEVTAEPSPQSAALPLFERVAVSGRVRATPTIEIKAPLEVAGTKATTLIEGSGRDITEGSPVLVAITAFDGETGQTLSESGRPQLSLGIVGSDVIGDELTSMVVGQREGTRMVAFRTIAPGAGAPGATSGIEVDVIVASAHRTPAKVHEYAENARENGVGVIIAAAGAAAHLAGVIASYTTLPVIGVPINATPLNGLDALLSTVQMPMLPRKKSALI